MVIFRCTRRVLKRFKLAPVDTDCDLGDATRLGPWYANLLNIGRTRYVICASSQTLLPVILPARNSEFPERFGAHLSPVLLGVGIPAAYAVEEVEALRQIRIAKTANRSVLGSLNDFARLAQHLFAHGLSPLQVALALADTPMGGIASTWPNKATLEVFGLSLPKPARVDPRHAGPAPGKVSGYPNLRDTGNR